MGTFLRLQLLLDFWQTSRTILQLLEEDTSMSSVRMMYMVQSSEQVKDVCAAFDPANRPYLTLIAALKLHNTRLYITY
ncbi:unnamed protein product [Caenorhabditis brenneri]